MKLLLKFASGPLAFFLLQQISFPGLPSPARIVLAVFGWMVMWWMLQPVPWAITSLLPLVLFPGMGIMPIGKAAGMYGQNLFFFLWGTILMGYAVRRHGLAKRFALWFLSLRGMGSNTRQLGFGFMLVTGILSGFISDTAVVAMMIPIAMSLVSHVRMTTGISSSERSNFGAFMALGTLYGAVAGGNATVAGRGHNPLGVALLREFTGRTLGWFDWMITGVPIFLVTLITYFLILRIFLPPEVSTIPGGKAMIHRERQKLGPLTAGEGATLFVFATMVFLFMLPTFIRLALGPIHPFTLWVNTSITIWTVPVAVLLLLFSTPVNWRKGEFVLTWREAAQHSPWNIMLLVTAAVAVAGTLGEFGFVEFVGKWISGLGVGPAALPFFSAYLVAFGTNFFSGAAATSLFGSILIPGSQQIGFSPASMATLIPKVAVGIMLPWAGAAAGTAFASGEIEMKNMIRVGAVATLIIPFLVAGMHVCLAPFLQ